MDKKEFFEIDPVQANEFRTMAGAALVMGLVLSVIQKPFDAKFAADSMSRYEQAWQERFGSVGACLSTPWSGRLTDCGQAGNGYVKRELSHPLVAACRWGSSEAIEWLCAHHDIDPVVRFVDAAEFWSFFRAGVSGISGAFEPLWSKCKASGWSHALLGEAASSWLMGVQDGPMDALAASLGAVRPALSELILADPSWTVPLASAATFGTALSAAICTDENDGGPGREVQIQALIELLPANRWRHESLIDGSEIWQEDQSKPGSPGNPRSFIEDAISIGNPWAAEILAKAGFEMPSLDAALRARGGIGSALADPASQRAFEVVSRHWCDVESSEINKACQGAKASGPKSL